MLFDQPHVVAAAADAARGASPTACAIVAGSFFESVPTGGDAYVLKSIVHDWEDEEAIAILARLPRARWRRTARLLVIERILGAAERRRRRRSSPT